MSEPTPDQTPPSSLCGAVIYTPRDGEPQEFPFDLFKLSSFEAEDIEDLGFWDTYQEWGERLLMGNRKAVRALLWIMLRRSRPELEFEAVAVTLDELRVRLGDGDEVEKPEGKDEPDAAATDSP